MSFLVLAQAACFSSGNAFVSGTDGLRFKFRAYQMGHGVVNRSPPLQHFFEKSGDPWEQRSENWPRQLVTLWCSTASIMQDLLMINFWRCRNFDTKRICTH